MSYLFFPSPTPIFPVLPPLTWSVHKKLISASRSITSVTGRDTSLACAVFPRWAFTLSYGGGNSWLRDQTQNTTPDTTLAGFTELQQLSALFLACLGSYGEFYYNDPDDNSRLAQAVGVGNNSQTIFPLSFTWGNGPFNPTFTSPVQGIQAINTVYINGSPISSSLYTTDTTNTKLVFLTAPSSGTITADFSFYFRCRFLDDELKLSQWAQNLWDVKEVRFESVKP